MFIIYKIKTSFIFIIILLDIENDLYLEDISTLYFKALEFNVASQEWIINSSDRAQRYICTTYVASHVKHFYSNANCVGVNTKI